MILLHKVEGIVIRTTDYGETNKIVTLYTREKGKVAVMARGAKRPRSRLASSAQLFIYGIFVYHRNSGIGTFNQADMIDSFREIRVNLNLTAQAAVMVELLDKLTEDHQPNPYLFELLYQSLHYLNEGLDPDIITRIYEMKMLYVAGASPVLDCCCSCGSTEGSFVFSMKNAGLLCSQCKIEDPHHSVIHPTVLKLLKIFQHIDMKRLGNIKVKDETKKQLKEFIAAYYDEFVGVYLKSKRFLDQIERMDEI